MDVGDELDLAFEEEFNHKDIDYLDRLDEEEVEDFDEIFEPEKLKLDGVGLAEEKVHILWLVYSSKYIFSCVSVYENECHFDIWIVNDEEEEKAL